MKTSAIPAIAVLVGVAALAVLSAVPWGGEDEGAEGITVLAAASLTDALESAAASFRRAGGGPVRLDFASSGALRMKTLRGARADVFLSASTRDMDMLAEAGMLLEGTRRSLLANRLVCVVPAGSRLNVSRPEDLTAPSIRRLAVADPQHAPAGWYAEQALRRLGLWSALDGWRVTCDNVRAALAHAEAGSVEAAVVYRSDAQSSAKVKVAFAFPPDSHAAIVYPMAVLKGTRHRAAAEAFCRFLAAPAQAAMFASYGFEPLEGQER